MEGERPDSPEQGAKKASTAVRATEVKGPTDADEFIAQLNAQAADIQVIEFKTPEWFEMILAATGILELMFRIEDERIRRADDYYHNPYPEIATLIASMNFEMFIGGAVIVNCLLIGWEASVEEGENADMFNALEHLFVIFFLVEWIMRILACGWVWLFEMSNFVDTVLVWVTGVLTKWVMAPMGIDVGSIRIYTALRSLRLVRIARAVRLMPAFKEMWILIQGLTTSTRLLVWTIVMATSVLYMFAVFGTDVIGKYRPVGEDPLADELFGNLYRSMFTMVQLITLDTWCDTITRPLMETQPGIFVPFFCVTFISIGVFVFWNLITAIIVENADYIAQQDSAQQAKQAEGTKMQELKALGELFLEIDKDGSGELTTEEFFGALNNKKVQEIIVLLELKPSELQDVWNILDDGDGVLTIKEFTNGLRRMKGQAKAKDIIDVCKQLGTTHKLHDELQKNLTTFAGTIKKLEDDVSQVAKDTDEVLGLFMEMYHRLCAHIERGERQDDKEMKKRNRLADEEERKAILASLLPDDTDDEEDEPDNGEKSEDSAGPEEEDD